MPQKKFEPLKLKVNLKLVAQRLKNAQVKRANQQVINRKEIAKLLAAGKEDSAYVKVEVIIREDKNMEAMELTELFCQLLIARFGVIETMKYCDDSIYEAVCSVLWVAPRFPSEAKELAGVRDQLLAKYGAEFCMNAMENKGGCVNEKLMKRLDVRPPSRKLVIAYLEEIALTSGIDWVAPPDPLAEEPKAPKKQAELPKYEEAAPATKVVEPPVDTTPEIDTSPNDFVNFLNKQTTAYQMEKDAGAAADLPPVPPPAVVDDDSDSDDPFGDINARLNKTKAPSTSGGNSSSSHPGPPPAGMDDSDSDDDEFGDLTSRFNSLKDL